MALFRRTIAGLRALFQKSRGELELEQELKGYFESLVERYLAAGMTREAAARAARLETGSLESVKEQVREVGWESRAESVWMDLRYAFRVLTRAPGFSALAILTLALGVGSVTIIYSVIHDVLLDPLPYPGSDRFVNVGVADTETGRGRRVLPPAEFLDFQEQSSVFEIVIGTRGDSMVLTTDERAEFVRVVHVTPNFFGAMRLNPILGRVIQPQDGEPDAPPVAVLRHRAWVSYFGADPAVVGHTIQLDGESRTVVGVMPPRFTWHAADVWIPSPIRRGGPNAPGAWRNFQARLKPGVTLERAEAQLNVIAARRAREHPDEYPRNFRVDVVNIIEEVVGDFRLVLYTALAAVGLLLLIACCNVANMLLARATVREREMTVRAALGASQWRILRQVLVESMLLGLLGGVSGCLLAYVGVTVLVRYLPEGPLPGEVEFGLDGGALAVNLAVALCSALLFGIAPALYSARRNLVAGLNSDTRAVAGSRGGLRGALVAAEIALSLVLLFSAGLLMRSFISLVRVDLGFDPRNILVFFVMPSPRDHTTTAARRQLDEQLLERIRSLPGIDAAASSTSIPPFSAGYRSQIDVEGRPHNPQWTAQVQFCSDGYFRTMGIPFVRGGEWPAGAATESRQLAVVNQAFAASYMGEEDPIGRQVTVVLPARGVGDVQRSVVQITGVVRDIRNQGLQTGPVPQIYLAGATTLAPPTILVRTSGDPRLSVSVIRSEIKEVDRKLAVREPGTIEDMLRRSAYAQPRFSLLVLGAFATAGTLLVAIGVFGVMAYSVARQRREIAVRMALGASRRDVLGGVLGSGVRLLAIGIVAGVLASFAAARLISHQLWNTSAYDPLAFAGAVAGISVVTLAACYFPARRAMQVDPMQALRTE